MTLPPAVTPTVAAVAAAHQEAAVPAPDSPLYEELDTFQQAEEQQASKSIRLERVVTGSAAVVSVGFSVGYVIWIVRGGYLLTSLVSSLPAWRMFDPLAILEQVGNDDPTGNEDDRR